MAFTKNGKRLTNFALGSLILGAQSLSSYAQEMRLEEVFVTGEKRDISMQDVPAAVSALTASDLDRSNIINAADLDAQVPGLTIAKNEGFQRLVVIRGLGFEANQNDIANPSVSFHIDDVYISDPISLNQDLLDIERIEVMRGPQGTVFGQNSTGGTINVITKDPDLDGVYGNADITVGTYNTIRPRGAINIPLSDNVAVRMAASYNKHDGFAEVKGGPLDGYELDEEANRTARIKLLIQPSDEFSIILSAQNYDTDVHDRAQRNILDTSGDVRDLQQNYPGTFEFKSNIYSAKALWELPSFGIKYVASYQDEKQQATLDNDRGVPAFQPLQDIVPKTSRANEATTHEINIFSLDEDLLPFEWIVGAFYLDQEKEVTFLEFADFNGDGVIDQTIDPVDPFSNPDFSFETSSRPKRESLSFFFQTTFTLNDDLRLTTGARYTDDEVTSTVTNFFGAFGSQDIKESSDALTGKISLAWSLSYDHMVYVSWSKGYKPGGTNLTSAVLVQDSFVEEEVIAWEVGSKSDLLDGRVRLNAAAFLYDFENLQFMATDPIAFSGGVDNMPDTEIYGAEFEFSALLTDNLKLDGNATFLEGEFTSDKLALDNTKQILFDTAYNITQIENLKGNTPPKLPESALTVALTHTADVPVLGGVISSRVQYKYRDDYQYRVFNNPTLDTVPSLDLWNLSFLYTPNDQAWNLELLVTNVTDEEVVVSRFTNNFGVGHTSEEFAPPRQVLLRAGIEF